MNCNHDRSDLVAFHFGEDHDIGERLVACPDCLREFLAIKRAIDLGEDAPRPSELARERLRRAVAQRIAVAPRRWWHRPAAAAFAIAVLLASMAATQVLAPRVGEVTSRSDTLDHPTP
jgi:hypothetical protein